MCVMYSCHLQTPCCELLGVVPKRSTEERRAGDCGSYYFEFVVLRKCRLDMALHCTIY